MAWLAHGSDYGGSLSPASFCSIVGMRPSPGRIVSNVCGILDQTLGVNGPMASNVKDLALFFDVLLGQTYKDPTSIPKEEKSFLNNALEKKPRKVAITKIWEFSSRPNNKRICWEAGKELEKLGIVEEATPDLSEAPYTSQILVIFILCT